MSGSLVVVVRNKRSKGTSPVKYEIFDFYSKIAKSLKQSKWEETFTNFSKGVLHPSMKIDLRSNVMKVTSSGYVIKIKIPEEMNVNDLSKDDEKSYKRFKEFLKESIPSFSEKKKEEINVETEEESESDEELDNKFKSGISSQIVYLDEYVRRICSSYDITESRIESIKSTLNALFATKELNSKSVMLNKRNGTINYIIGVTINSNGLFIDRDCLIKCKDVDSQEKNIKDKVFKSSVLLSKSEAKRKIYEVDDEDEDD